MSNPVTPAQAPLWTESLEDSLLRRFRRRIFVLEEPQRRVVNASADSDSRRTFEMLKVISSRCHPLIDAVHVAFSKHYPLTLSPDCIWLSIVQGFSHHVGENSEKLRHRLVRHEGRRNLAVPSSGLTPSSFHRAVADLSAQIREATDSVVYETLICDSSTTTAAIRTASEVALMDAYSSYFTYEMRCICGIPRITIQGSVEDWRRIRARVEVLGKFGLTWWVSRLRPLLDEFVLAVGGRPTREFWKAIYKPQEAYGNTEITGWIADLFPYLGDGPDRARNPVFAHERREWALPVAKGVDMRPWMSRSASEWRAGGVRERSFPSGLSSVPFKVSFQNGSATDVCLVAGFFAVEQNPLDLSLAPVIGWSVTEPAPKKPVLID